MKLKAVNLAVGTMLATLALPSLADDPALRLEPMVVTGGVYEQALDQTAANVNIINRQELDRVQADDLKSSIRYEPGVTVNNDATRYGNDGFNIRGIEGNRIVMMVDGTRMNDNYIPAGHGNSSVVSRGGIEFDAIRQVDIVKGPFSALYGNDALGGAVNFNTWQPSDLVSDAKPYHFGFKQSFNSKNQGRASTVSAAGKSGIVSGLVMLTKRDSEETKNKGTIGGEGKPRTKPNPQDNDAYNILSKVTIGDGAHKVDLSAEYFNQKRKTDVLTALGPGRGGTNTLKNKGDDKLKRQRFGLDYNYRVDDGIIRAVSASYAYSKTNAENITAKLVKGPGPAPAKSSQELFKYDQTAHSLHTQLNAVIEQSVLSHNIVAGAEYRADTLNPRNKINGHQVSPKSQKNNFDIYVLDEMQFNHGFTVTPALRYSHYSLKPKHDSEYLNTNPGVVMAKKLSDGKFSPSLSFKLPIGEVDTAFLALSSGFKSPPLQAMNAFSFSHGSFNVTFVPNPNLKSETSKSLELGWRHNGDNWQAKVTTYYNNFRNYIDDRTVDREFTIDGAGKPKLSSMKQQYINLDKVKTYGIEMAAAYRFDNHISVSSGFSWMKGKQGNEKLSSAQPPKLTLGIGYEKEQWGVNANLSLVKKMTNIDLFDSNSSRHSIISVPGYGLTDVTAYWNLRKNIKLTAGVYNVFDKKHWHTSDAKFAFNQTALSDLHSQPGRSFAASIKIDF